MRSFASLVLLVATAWSPLLAADRDPFAAAHYPHFRGPDGSGAAADTGTELVDDLTHARLAWCSEIRNPLPVEHTVLWGNQIYPPWPMNCENNGGFASPAIAGGKAYVAFWRPTGTATSPNPRKGGGEAALIDGDDCLACIDLATGRTEWVTAFEGKGANLVAVRARDGQITPCVAEGKVFFLGSIGRLYCVDAATGEKRWDLVATHKARVWELYKRDLMAGRLKPRSGDPPWKQYREEIERDPPHPELGGSGGRNFNATPVVSRGVAVFGVNRDCVGVDVESGKPLWRHGGVLTTSTSPVIWRHDGVERVVCYGRGKLTCIDPADGGVVWRHGVVGGSYQGHTPAIAGDHLVCTGRSGDEKRAEYHVAGYRLSPEGAAKVWTFADGSRLTYNSPTIYRGRVYFQGRPYVDRLPPGAIKLDRNTRKLLYCVDLETGETLAVAPAGGGCASMFAMDERLYYAQGVPQFYWSTEPDERGRLPLLSTRSFHNADSTTATGSAGLMLRRGVGNMVYCWDLRAGQDGPKDLPEPEAPPGERAYQLDLAGALADRRDLRLHLVARDGAFVQAWATADEHAMPELCWSDDLAIEGDRIRGTVRCWIGSGIIDYRGKYRDGGRHYRFAIDARIDGASLSGTYREAVIERIHFAMINGRYQAVSTEDEHHVDPTAGTLAGACADDVRILGPARYDRAMRDEYKRVRDLPDDDPEGIIRASRDSVHPVSRRAAVERLARSVSPVGGYQKPIAALYEVAKHDPHLSVRLKAIRRMTHNGYLYPMLVELLEDDEPTVRAYALASIARIRERARSPAGSDVIAAIRRQATHPDLRVRAGAINALGRMREEGLAHVLEIMEGDDLDDDTVEECLRALDRSTDHLPAAPVEHRAAIRERVLAAIARPDLEKAPLGRGLRCLMRTGEAAIANLGALCGPGYPAAIRREALTQIESIGSNALAVLPQVVAATRDDDAAIRERALGALGSVCDHDIDEAPVPELDARAVRTIFAMLDRGRGYIGDHVEFRSALLLSLAIPDHRDLILEHLSRADSRQTMAVIEAFARRGPASEPDLPTIRAAADRIRTEDNAEELDQALAAIRED